MTFAEFMRIVLYDPIAGFYTAPIVPPMTYGGHFLTAPEVHSAFGALLAKWSMDAWHTSGNPHQWTVAELGPGTGALAEALLAASRPYEAYFAALRYRLIEPSPSSRRAQRLRLAPFGAKVAWWQGTPRAPFAGVVLGNEILDALPFHRLRRAAQDVVEQYVVFDGEILVEQSGPPSPPARRLLDHIDAAPLIRGGFELSVAASDLITRWANVLRSGSLLCIDYGDTASTLWSIPRPRGTLTTYHRHHQGYDPFILLGEQDITAQVNFTVAEHAAAAAGLYVHPLVSQGAFLQALGWARFWERATSNDERASLAALVDINGLGGFKVMTATAK